MNFRRLKWFVSFPYATRGPFGDFYRFSAPFFVVSCSEVCNRTISVNPSNPVFIPRDGLTSTSRPWYNFDKT